MTFKNNANPELWRSGWPPFTGWWNMSKTFDKQLWRWVNLEEKQLSIGYYPLDHLPKRELSYVEFANIKDFKYRDYWPENARVDRVNPKGLKCK
jgi:hypothetical protein